MIAPNSKKLIIFICLLFMVACNTPVTKENEIKKPSDRTQFHFGLGGAPIDVFVTLSQAKLELTDFLELTIETKYEEGVLVTPVYLTESTYLPLLLVENPKENTFWSEKDKRFVNRWIYKFEPMLSGDFEIKPFKVGFRLAKEKTDDLADWPSYQVQTESIPYTVKPVEMGSLEDIRGIKGMILPGFKFMPLILTILTIAIAVTTLFAFRYYLSSRSTEQVPEIPLIDHYVKALERLDALENRNLLNNSEFDDFHTELADILRDYIEEVFDLRPKEQTTEEFIKEISTANAFNNEQQILLDRFLHLSDLVKFATFQPGSQISSDAMKNVRSFIESTGKPHEI